MSALPLSRSHSTHAAAGFATQRVLLAIALVSALLASALLALTFSSDYGLPRGAVARWSAVVRAGDVDTLRTDLRLGSRSMADELVRSMGEDEYRRVLALYDRARDQGAAEYNRLRNAVLGGGRAAFLRLPLSEQRALGRRSHEAWVLERGVTSLPDVLAAVGTWQRLAQWPPEAALLQRLGTAALSADERTLLGDRALSDPAVQADAMLREVATRRQQSGEAQWRALRERAVAAGEQGFRGLDYDQRTAIDEQSMREFVLAQGGATLSAADRAAVPNLGDLEGNDSPAADALRRRLGLRALSAAEQSAISPMERPAFVLQHEVFVEREGRRLASLRLRAIFSAARYELVSDAVRGDGPRDLVRRRAARVVVRWTALGGALPETPDTFDLLWSRTEREWRIAAVHWNPTASSPVTADSEPGVVLDLPPARSPRTPASGEPQTGAPADEEGNSTGGAQ